MKFIVVLLFVLGSFAVNAQNASSTVTFNGIGKLRLGMSTIEVEKLLGKKIQLKQLPYMEYDTIRGIVDHIPVALIFKYNDFEKLILNEIHSENSELRTKSGIGMGDDKFKIINTYPNYMIEIYPEHDTKPVTKYKIEVYNNESKVIIFQLINNKVQHISVAYPLGVNH